MASEGMLTADGSLESLVPSDGLDSLEMMKDANKAAVASSRKIKLDAESFIAEKTRQLSETKEDPGVKQKNLKAGSNDSFSRNKAMKEEVEIVDELSKQNRVLNETDNERRFEEDKGPDLKQDGSVALASEIVKNSQPSLNTNGKTGKIEMYPKEQKAQGMIDSGFASDTDEDESHLIFLKREEFKKPLQETSRADENEFLLKPQTPIVSKDLSPSKPCDDSPNSAANVQTYSETSALETVKKDTESKMLEENVQNLSFWGILKQELGFEVTNQSFSSANASVEDDVFNFIRVPVEVERVIVFGFFLCADSLMFLFFCFPFRVARALFCLVLTPIRKYLHWGLRFNRAQLYDLLRGIIMIIAFYMLLQTPMSRIYHYIRGQTFLKLYVFFNMLDILDRLMLSIGQDILDSLYYITRTEPYAVHKILIRLVLGILYVCLHSILYFLRLITLNVAINSSSNALFTLLLSNNFLELKSSVFKRTAEQHLFQITCADIVERFELFVFLALAALQSMKSLKDFVLGTAIYIFATEIVVDWIKHAFITKFNRISFESYVDQKEALCREAALIGISERPYSGNQRLRLDRPADPTQAVAQRLGFATLPFTCVICRILWLSIPDGMSMASLRLPDVAIAFLILMCCFALKSLLNIVLRGHACQTLINREEAILSDAALQFADLASTTSEKEFHKAISAKHMQRISNLSATRRYMLVHRKAG